MLEKNGLVKLSEENGELIVELLELHLAKASGKLIQTASKKMTCMDTDVHWDGKGSLKERLEDEIADVAGISEAVIANFGLDRERIVERSKRKYELFMKWKTE